MGQTKVTVTDKSSNAPLDNATFAPPAGLPADSVAVTARASNVYTVQWNDTVDVTGQVYCSDATDYPAEGGYWPTLLTLLNNTPQIVQLQPKGTNNQFGVTISLASGQALTSQAPIRIEISAGPLPGNLNYVPASLTINWGDGTTVSINNPGFGGWFSNHTFNNPGNYTITATLVDTQNVSVSATLQLSLTAPPPRLWAVFIADNGTNGVLVCSSTDGKKWSNNNYIEETSPLPASSITFNGRLYAAFIANDPSNRILLCSSIDGVTWTMNNIYVNQTSKLAPSMAVFNNRLYMAFIANDQSNRILLCSSADGINWTTDTIYVNETSKLAPSIAVFNDQLYIAFVANDQSNRILLCSSADGLTWTNDNVYINQTSKLAPSIAVFNNRLYIAFIANDPSNRVYVCSSADWANNIWTNQLSDLSPSLAVLNGVLYIAFVATNVNAILVCSSADGNSWQNSNTELGQYSNLSPFLMSSA